MKPKTPKRYKKMESHVYCEYHGGVHEATEDPYDEFGECNCCGQKMEPDCTKKVWLPLYVLVEADW